MFKIKKRKAELGGDYKPTPPNEISIDIIWDYFGSSNVPVILIQL